ncbi:hypothetical protein [Corynebacterium sp. HMSC074H12]|uniref:hypothetical protein n=1 Tax=Corynebacterium sp. HMSC074H12 TaxID=1739436 RepID=UPI0008C49B21|nr:hypothetical protein [Corynebacterium sp. HMSC074H12]OFQ55094.1 hypothetical protein HMPREF2932_11830 [Corynebacterium sp. HMSC074H12]
MNNFSRALLAATLTGSLAFAGTTVASAEEAATATSCGSPKAEFTATVNDKEHTFKKVSEFIWTSTSDENVKLNRAQIFDLAKAGAPVCDSESIDLGDWGASQGGPGKVDYDIVDGERQDPAPVEDEDKDKDKTPSEDKDKDKNEQDKDKDKDNKDKGEPSKDKKSSVKDELSSEDNKPTPLGIAAIVAGVLAVIAAAFPFVKNALKL